MSVQSSSASWSAQDAQPADIIDLDKFMRGGVRPSRPETRLQCGLVVDAGGAGRKPALAAVARDASSSGSSSQPHAKPQTKPQAKPHAKRFSHDSGLSDGSYARRKHRPHRRPAIADGSIRNREQTSARTVTVGKRDSSHSFRAFRTVCERAMLEQQQQIARVAQLCERLTARRDRATTDTSDVSSSSQSTKDLRRRDKHRIDECKTYKIIMTKLDELNRLFIARAQAQAPHSPPAPAAPRRALPSSSPVSVSDKLVSTEPELKRQNIVQSVRRCETVVSERAESGAGGGGAGGGGARRAAGRGVRLRAVTNTCDLDIAPCDALPNRTRPNVATESVVQHGGGGGGGGGGGSGASACDDWCRFDLDDPIHLYSQAKRLPGLKASPITRRVRSVEQLLTTRLANKLDDKLDARLGGGGGGGGVGGEGGVGGGGKGRDTTLCALCRGYWRALRHYLAAQVFGHDHC